jgi:poly(3-hydroxyalkanoate) synthetase
MIKNKNGVQHCIKEIACEVVKSRSVHLINFCGGGQVIALRSANAFILDRYIQ